MKDNAGVAMDPALVGASGPSILAVWFPGQEDGNITADLLFGVVNPSGKSPFTYPFEGKGFLDSLTAEQFPGVVVDGQQTVTYTERNSIGYRWYDENCTDGSCVAFPFGHGLSYTDFQMSKLTVTPKTNDGTHPIKVQFFVENTGRWPVLWWRRYTSSCRRSPTWHQSGSSGSRRRGSSPVRSNVSRSPSTPRRPTTHSARGTLTPTNGSPTPASSA